MSEENILDEAKRLVLGGRQEDYGKPERNFGTIASMWNAFLGARKEPSSPITETDVALMMCLLKVARQANRPKRDNLVDLAGYALTAEIVESNLQNVRGSEGEK